MAVEDAKVSDIVAYHSPPDKTMIHRVVQIKTYPGRTLLITQGDANPVTDQTLGFPPVTTKNLIGKVFCLDGAPMRVPFIGLYIVQARNFAIWLTQNKIWAFWGPLVAIIYIFGPYLSPGGISQFNLRNSLRAKIPVKTLLAYILIGFAAISAFTFYFKTESYTLSMRVACLLETKEPTYISFGSMTYEEERDNTIEVTGAPLFPVKTVAMVLGNASMFVFAEPKTMTVEPQEYTSLNLHAKIPPKGKVEPGIYVGTVYIFSDTLLLMLPDTLIFSAFYAMPDPWATLIVLDFLAASLLAFLIAFIAASVNTTSAQILYTLVWHDKLKRGFPGNLRMKIRSLRLKLSRINERISKRLSLLSQTVKREVELKKMLKPAVIAATPSAAIFLLLDNLLLPVITLGATMSLLLWRMHVRKKGELVTSAFFANILLTATFIMRRSVTILYAQINTLWCLVSGGFVGDISYLITVPIVLALMLTLVFGLDWIRVWSAENQTRNWYKMRPGTTRIEKTISIPSLEDFERLKRRRIKISPRAIPSEESFIGESRFIDMAKPIIALLNAVRRLRDSIRLWINEISWSYRIWSNRSILYPYIEGEL